MVNRDEQNVVRRTYTARIRYIRARRIYIKTDIPGTILRRSVYVPALELL